MKEIFRFKEIILFHEWLLLYSKYKTALYDCDKYKNIGLVNNFIMIETEHLKKYWLILK